MLLIDTNIKIKKIKRDMVYIKNKKKYWDKIFDVVEEIGWGNCYWTEKHIKLKADAIIEMPDGDNQRVYIVTRFNADKMKELIVEIAM